MIVEYAESLIDLRLSYAVIASLNFSNSFETFAK